MFETYLKLVGYDIGSATAELKQIQALSHKEFYKWQEDQKWSIAKHHYDNNPYYRNIVGNYFPDKWEDLPIMEKSDYQNDLEKLLSKGYTKKNTYIANTSGSSGHPFFFAKNKEAHAMTWALIKNRYSWYELKLNSKQARFLGTPLETTSNTMEKIKHFVINRVLFAVFDLSDNTLRIFLKKMKKTKFEYIYGYTNSLVLFARYLIKKEIVLQDECPTLRHCIVTSEVLTHEDRKILSKGFGVNIVNEYGISETGAIVAFDDINTNWLINKETQFVEIVDRNQMPLEDGDMGEIIITDLYNKAMPFIRYKVGDIGTIKKDIIIDGYKVLDNLQGRINDNVQLPSGKISPGLTFYYISRSILESSGVLKEFIIRQIALDTFIFDVVSDRDLYNHEIKEIENKMSIYLEPGLLMKINRVQKIKRPRSGKLKHFYSELNI
ncbi:MAG: phenylacetate--CoA ligase family protein [Bacteroidetes bacterium]|nr:phenylacetate--CoA ligase family protein [Bacteroidota bacterium]